MKKPKQDGAADIAASISNVLSLLHGVSYQCVDKTAVSLSTIFVNEVPMMRFEARWNDDQNHTHAFLSDSVNCSNPKELAGTWKVLNEFATGLIQKRGKPVILPNGK